MALKIKVNDPHFQLEYPRRHVWCKFGDSSSNLWRVIVQTRSVCRWTDGRTDKTQARTIPLWSKRAWGKKNGNDDKSDVKHQITLGLAAQFSTCTEDCETVETSNRSRLWTSLSIPLPPKNQYLNRDFNQAVLHLWSKFGDPRLNTWWVIADKL